MQINELPIPERLVALLASERSTRYSGSRPLHRAQDHYGNSLETELGQVFQTADEMQRETEALARHYVADGTTAKNWTISLAPARYLTSPTLSA